MGRSDFGLSSQPLVTLHQDVSSMLIDFSSMRRVSRYLILAFCCVLAICFLWKESLDAGLGSERAFSPEPGPDVKAESWRASSPSTKMVVMGKLSTEDTGWVQEHLPEYVTNNQPWSQ